MTGQDVVRRALSTYGKGWVYEFGAKPGLVPEGARGVWADCTGWAWWCAGKAQAGRIRPGQGQNSWVPLQAPRAGCVVWHSADVGKTSGHVGIVIKVYPGGEFDSLDCSSTPPGPRGGAVRLVRGARSLWTRAAADSWGFDWPVWVTDGPAAGGLAAKLGGLAAVVAVAGAIYAAGRTAQPGTLQANLRKMFFRSAGAPSTQNRF